jgi:xanthine dehydrogenase YagS FAD-binding subunit
MKDFKIAQPQTLSQVTSLLAEKKEGYYLMAGGTDLLDEIKNEVIEPEAVVDLKAVPGLSTIIKEKDAIRIGALTTVADLAEDPVITNDYPGLRQAALSLATPQLRNVGTVGGNLCQRPRCWYYRDPQVICRKKGGSRCFASEGRNKYHAVLGGGICFIVHPSDLAPAFISLDARITISSAKGEKTIPLEDFFILPQVNVKKENILEPGEVVKEVKIPLAKKGEKSAYYKLKERGTWDFAIVSAAVKALVSAGAFKDVRVVLGGVAPIPWRLKQVENSINGRKPSEDLLRKATREALREARPLEENGYKLDLIETAVYRAAFSLV